MFICLMTLSEEHFLRELAGSVRNPVYITTKSTAFSKFRKTRYLKTDIKALIGTLIKQVWFDLMNNMETLYRYIYQCCICHPSFVLGSPLP